MVLHLDPTFINIYHRGVVPGDLESRHTNTIIIAASASAGGVILTLILLRIFWRCCRRGSGSVPLPPVQPLAHVREQQLAHFIEQNDSALLSAPMTFLPSSRIGSKVSLLQKEPSSSSMPSSHSSLGLGDTSEVLPALPTQTEVLSLPPQFQAASPSPSSPGSETGTTTLPETPHSFNSSSVSHNHSTSSTQFLIPDRARSTSRPRMRPRPVSMTSISSITTTSRSSRTIRGVPHGPHSNVKIVLPAPLASVLHPYMEGRRHTSMDGGYDHQRRLSVVDKWAPKAVKSSGSLHREGRSHSLDRVSSSSQSSSSRRSHSSPHRTQPRNRTSSPSLPAGSYPTTPSSRSQLADAPPVPRIPSVYNTYTSPELDRSSSQLAQLEEREADLRGRSRGASILAASRSSSNSRSRPQQQNKLQKKVESRPHALG